jgi:hypothetical protein
MKQEINLDYIFENPQYFTIGDLQKMFYGSVENES